MIHFSLLLTGCTALYIIAYCVISLNEAANKQQILCEHPGEFVVSFGYFRYDIRYIFVSSMQDMIDHSTNAREVAASTKRKEKLQKQLKECRDYDEMIAHLALSRIELDLDDGVKVNYEKIQTASDGKKYAVLAKI